MRLSRDSRSRLVHCEQLALTIISTISLRRMAAATEKRTTMVGFGFVGCGVLSSSEAPAML